MKLIGMTGFLVLLCAVSKADAESDRDKLNGSWVEQGEAENSWTLNADGKTMHITETERGTKIADFKCDTQGAGCEVKIAGKKVMVSMWFNDSKLMQIETRGSDVLERSFAILSQGDVMEMKIIPVAPTGKIETFQYKRAPLSAQGK
jgi:hypothetical protein